MSASTFKKLGLAFCAFVFLCWGLNALALRYIVATTPAFLEELVETLPFSPNVARRIGEYESYDLTYNEHTPTTDTLAYALTIRGTEAQMRVRGYALYDKEWTAIKADTVYTRY